MLSTTIPSCHHWVLRDSTSSMFGYPRHTFLVEKYCGELWCRWWIAWTHNGSLWHAILQLMGLTYFLSFWFSFHCHIVYFLCRCGFSSDLVTNDTDDSGRRGKINELTSISFRQTSGLVTWALVVSTLDFPTPSLSCWYQFWNIKRYFHFLQYFSSGTELDISTPSSQYHGLAPLWHRPKLYSCVHNGYVMECLRDYSTEFLSL